MLGGAEGIVKGHGWLYGRHLAVMWPLDAGGRVTVHLYVPRRVRTREPARRHATSAADDPYLRLWLNLK